MGRDRIAPEVNAGSMADIAFLLLIFFLVTTTISHDVGFNRMLPPEKEKTTVDIQSRNLLEISVNENNDLMVEGELIPLSNLRSAVVNFLDNGGMPQGQIGFCNYCNGERSSLSSDNPDKAIVSLKTSRNSDYAFYVAVQNEIIGAYNSLRNREGQRLYGTSYVSLVSDFNESNTSPLEKKHLKEKIEALRAKFPLKFVEPQTLNLN